jgi:hypothetical protein
MFDVHSLLAAPKGQLFTSVVLEKAEKRFIPRLRWGGMVYELKNLVLVFRGGFADN